MREVACPTMEENCSVKGSDGKVTTEAVVMMSLVGLQMLKQVSYHLWLFMVEKFVPIKTRTSCSPLILEDTEKSQVNPRSDQKVEKLGRGVRKKMGYLQSLAFTATIYELWIVRNEALYQQKLSLYCQHFATPEFEEVVPGVEEDYFSSYEGGDGLDPNY
ncbi:hypothetical protein ACH5RR_029208 [Cinchona calisaya]|uniref:Uncharacterized protein n=1 Tax=Cinchona calisaya TaxID=153742 RepID=A0ABD2YVF8_9GENT